MQVALSGAFYDLVADLLRFIVPQRDSYPVYEMLTEQAHAAEMVRAQNSVPTRAVKVPFFSLSMH